MLATNTFLQGPFAPVTDEITAFDLPVTGRIPAELNGRYLRNRPNPLGTGRPRLPLVAAGEAAAQRHRLASVAQQALVHCPPPWTPGPAAVRRLPAPPAGAASA